jgi:hypothetical protein
LHSAPRKTALLRPARSQPDLFCNSISWSRTSHSHFSVNRMLAFPANQTYVVCKNRSRRHGCRGQGGTRDAGHPLREPEAHKMTEKLPEPLTMTNSGANTCTLHRFPLSTTKEA